MFRLLNNSSKPSSIYGPRFRYIQNSPLFLPPSSLFSPSTTPPPEPKLSPHFPYICSVCFFPLEISFVRNKYYSALLFSPGFSFLLFFLCSSTSYAHPCTQTFNFCNPRSKCSRGLYRVVKAFFAFLAQFSRGKNARSASNVRNSLRKRLLRRLQFSGETFRANLSLTLTIV